MPCQRVTAVANTWSVIRYASPYRQPGGKGRNQGARTAEYITWRALTTRAVAITTNAAAPVS